jgi:phage baseplate assembly protein W
MYINFPYQVGTYGRTSTTDRSGHIQNLIRQVLFTAPGERVNRPDFGSGLNQLVFEPNSVELTATVQFLVKGALQQWLSEVIEVEDVNIEAVGSTLRILIVYTETESGTRDEVTFERSF